MRKKLKKFWSEPVNRFWLICAFGTLFALCFGTYTFFKESFDPVISLGLISVSLVFEVVFLIALIINVFADTKREYLEAFQEINRDLRYRHYQNKNKDKEYKGPNWDDDNFVKISDLKNRVDSFVKASTEYQQVDFKRWKKSNVDINLDHSSQTAKRVLSVIIASIISLLILFTLCKWLELDSTTISILIKDSRSPVLAALITTVITSPIIFIIWIFRDKNNRVQIENARKDTNLKDFQKLSEWASGFHLPEIKQTMSTKITNKTAQDVQETIEETTTSQEDFIAPKGSNSISRSQGAEALQASAIAQLETFMLGKYGEQFMQPAFLLIHAIWESIITQQQSRYADEEEFKKSLFKLHENPIVAVLNRALTGSNGNHLRIFESQLIKLNLTGLSTTKHLSKELNLIGINLIGINLSHAYLNSANMQEAKLIKANLHSANLISNNLQKANFSYSNLTFASLRRANLQYANLEQTDLSNANLQFTNLNFANLGYSIMRNANLTCARLHGTNLEYADLTDANFNRTQINHLTIFADSDDEYHNREIREDVLSRGAIWDDDPNWLIGKIEDKDLLEKIFKDCEYRQKN